MSKVCNKCLIEKPLSEFYKTSTYCIECNRKLDDDNCKDFEHFSFITFKFKNSDNHSSTDYRLCVESCKNLIYPFEWITAVLFNDEWFEVGRTDKQLTAKKIHYHVKNVLRKNKYDVNESYIKNVIRDVENRYLNQLLLY
jgi:hypothetical protein